MNIGLIKNKLAQILALIILAGVVACGPQSGIFSGGGNSADGGLSSVGETTGNTPGGETPGRPSQDAVQGPSFAAVKGHISVRYSGSTTPVSLCDDPTFEFIRPTIEQYYQVPGEGWTGGTMLFPPIMTQCEFKTSVPTLYDKQGNCIMITNYKFAASIVFQNNNRSFRGESQAFTCPTEAEDESFHINIIMDEVVTPAHGEIVAEPLPAVQS